MINYKYKREIAIKKAGLDMISSIRANWAKSLTGQAPLGQFLADAAKAKTTKATSAPTRTTPANKALGMHVGRGFRFGNLDWFPVWTDEAVKPRTYTTSFTAGTVKISELREARVSGVQIENTGSTGVLLLEGTLLEGGLQHRALTRSVFVAANQAVELPVVCIEQGRWAGTSRQNIGAKLAPAKVRAAMRGMSRGNNQVIQAGADQTKVWEEIQGYQQGLAAPNQTGSYALMRDQIDQNQPELRSPEALAGQRGVIIAINGQPVALELFDHPDTLSERLDSIVRGYLPDSMQVGYVQTPSRRACRFADRISRVGVTEYEGPNHRRNVPDQVVAAEALYSEDQLLHLAALNARHDLVLAA